MPPVDRCFSWRTGLRWWSWVVSGVFLKRLPFALIDAYKLAVGLGLISRTYPCTCVFDVFFGAWCWRPVGELLGGLTATKVHVRVGHLREAE